MAALMARASDGADLGGHCPRCGAEYRSGFDTCSDCGVWLEPGPRPAPEGPPDMTDDQYRSALEELRAHPDRFVALATLPWVDAWSAANELWRHGIGAVFVPRDDALAPADPGCTGAGADDGRDRDDDDQPPPGLERVRGGSVQPWLRPNQPLIADAVLYVPAAHETEARAIAGRRLGIL